MKWWLLARYRYIKVKHAVGLTATPARRFRPSRARSTPMIFGAFLVLTVLGMLGNGPANIAHAATTRLDFSEGIQGFGSYAEINASDGGLQLQDGAVGAWERARDTIAMPNGTTNARALTTGPNGVLFALDNRDGCRLDAYDADLARWDERAQPPAPCAQGASLSFDGEHSLYFLPGEGSKSFLAYDIEKNAWKHLADAPNVIGARPALTAVRYENRLRFVLTPDNAQGDVWQYKVDGNTWDNLATFPRVNESDAKKPSGEIALAWDAHNTLFMLERTSGTLRSYSLTTSQWSDILATSDTCYVGALHTVKQSLFLLGNDTCKNTSIAARFDTDRRVWESLPTPASSSWQHGASATHDADMIVAAYTIGNATMLLRFDTNSMSWGVRSVASPQADLKFHGNVVDDGQDGFFIAAGKQLGRYTSVLHHDTQSRKSRTVGTFFSDVGAVMARSGTTLYGLGPEGTKTLQSMDITSGLSRQLPMLPVLTSADAQLIAGKDGNLYAMPGGTVFLRFDTARQAWEKLADLPTAITTGASAGALGGELYATFGSQPAGIFRFDGSRWDQVSGTPLIAADAKFKIATDSHQFGYLVATATEGTLAFRFERKGTSLSWRRIADMPVSLQAFGSGTASGGQYQLRVFPAPDAWIFLSWGPSTKAFATEGAWYSQARDMTQVHAWDSLRVDAQNRAQIEIQTRVSQEGHAWSTWTAVNDSRIMSLPARYLQVRALLHGDGSSTPIVHSISIDYAQESIPPNLPQQLHAFTARDGTEMVSGYAYAVQHPYFRWSPATDNDLGSGLEGYYVYFGTDDAANASEQGFWQIGTEFTATEAMQPGKVYTLRIATKDRVGNVSDTETMFRYRYNGEILPSAHTWSTSENFALGASEGLNIHDGALQLSRDAQVLDGRRVGRFTTEPVETHGVVDLSNFTLDTSVSSSCEVTVQTRTSFDMTQWNEWRSSVENKYAMNRIEVGIASERARYVQAQVAFSCGTDVPFVVDGMSLHYVADAQSPKNPTTFSAVASPTDETSLQSNSWYNNPVPMFSWPNVGEKGGATDGSQASGVAGYWVYVGSDEEAIPQTSGVFVREPQYSPQLKESGIYLVRLQTQDNAGNIARDVFSPFTYRFDQTSPTLPGKIEVTSSSISEENKFSFAWSDAQDNDSGIAAYCYRSGASSGVFADETCQQGTELHDLPIAYESGLNVIYVRALDEAGNHSMQSESVSFMLNTDAPDAVANLRVVPPSSSTNQFAFTWDLPFSYIGDPNQLDYCYSVNELPTATNTACTHDRFLAPFRAATKPGLNELYIVAKTSAGDVDWTKHASVTFTANIVSPGTPVGVSATDTSDRASERWSITLTWNPPTFLGNGIDQYAVERSQDNQTYAVIGSTSSQAFVDLRVTPNTTYFYRLRAIDSDNNASGFSSTVSAVAKGNYATPPQFVSTPTVVADASQASVKWKTDRAATSFVYCGTSPAELNDSKGTLDLAADHEVMLVGLHPNTMYYCKAQSFDSDRTYQLQETYSSIFSFRTREATRVIDFRVQGITADGMDLTWKTNDATKARIEYGTSLRYGIRIDATTTSSTQHKTRLSGLRSGTTYHIRVISTTSLGSTVSSDDYVIATTPRPIISGVKFQAVEGDTTRSVQVVWQTNVPTTSTVHYKGIGTDLEASQQEKVTKHVITLKGLASASDYDFVIEGRDQFGTLVQSDGHHWRSAVDTRPPNVSDVNVSASTMTTKRGQMAQLVVTWKTDEPATTQVLYGPSRENALDNVTTMDREPRREHLAIISNLRLSDVYAIQVVSKDLDGNSGYGAKTLLVTPDKEEGLLDRTLQLMNRVFRI